MPHGNDAQHGASIVCTLPPFLTTDRVALPFGHERLGYILCGKYVSSYSPLVHHRHCFTACWRLDDMIQPR